MSRNFEIAPGELYHIYNRGTDKRNIFTSARDYERFFTLLYVSNGNIPVHLQLQGSTLNKVTDIELGKKLVSIGAYCLMPNHFHIILRGIEAGGVSRFMQKLTTGYTMYFNKRHERSGSLFQGRYKAVHIEKDSYLKYLLAYIHLNPIKIIDSKWKEEGIKDLKKSKSHIEGYKYSSYLDYVLGYRLESCILDKDILPKYFDTSHDFRSYTNDLLESSRLNLEEIAV